MAYVYNDRLAVLAEQMTLEEHFDASLANTFKIT